MAERNIHTERKIYTAPHLTTHARQNRIQIKDDKTIPTQAKHTQMEIPQKPHQHNHRERQSNPYQQKQATPLNKPPRQLRNLECKPKTTNGTNAILHTERSSGTRDTTTTTPHPKTTYHSN